MYATLDQFTQNIGLAHAIRLSDRNNGNILDEPVIVSALEMAGAEINSHLSARFALPLPAGSILLRGFCIDIAAFRLRTDGVQESDAIRQKYDAAIKHLKAIAKGEAELDVAVPTSSGEVIIGSAQSVFMESNERLFSRDEMRGGL